MDQLSLLLASKDVFLSLSMQKIKTLKQAQQLLKNGNNPKIQSVFDQYHNIREDVFAKMNDSCQLINFDNMNLGINEKNPLSYYWERPSIVEVIGQKGSGKTALALNLCQQYARFNPNKIVTILNCSGGITFSRMTPFKQIKHHYMDIFCPEDIQEMMGGLKNHPNHGLVFLDGVNCIIMGANQRVGLGQILNTLKERGWTIIITNLIQGKLEVEEKEILNAQSYFPNIFGSIVDCRLRIDEHINDQNVFTVKTLKTVNNKAHSFAGKMTEEGLKDLTLQK